MDLVVARADLARSRSMTKPRLATLPSSASTASEPRWTQMLLPWPPPRHGGEHHVVILAAQILRRALGVAVEQARHFGREQHRPRRPPRLRRPHRPAPRRSPPGSMPVVDWKSAILVMAAISSSSLPSRSSAEQIVAAADMPAADENLRHGRAAVGALRPSAASPRRRNRPRSRDTRRPWRRAAAWPASSKGKRSWCRFRLGHVRILSHPYLGTSSTHQLGGRTTRAQLTSSTRAAPARFKRPRAGLGRAAGGQHVVDQDDRLARRPRFVAHSEGARDRLAPLQRRSCP